jgi:hypothetical protein
MSILKKAMAGITLLAFTAGIAGAAAHPDRINASSRAHKATLRE